MSYCNRCQQQQCTCSLPGVPQPFYAQAPMAAQCHTEEIIVNQQDLGTLILSSWNVPLCGGSVAVTVNNIRSVPIGLYINHKTYGYFEASAFDFDRQLLTLTNYCHIGNAAAGTFVPACTTFSMPEPPPCCDGTGQAGVFVKYDFTAPALNDCLDITLTSLEGIVGGNNVQIGTGIYFLQETKANDVVTICNRGEGITPGSPVIAQDAGGNYQYPVTVITINSCSADAVTDGVVLVCKEGGAHPLIDTVAGTGAILTQANNVDGLAYWSTAIPTEVAANTTGIATINSNLSDIYGNYILPQGVPQIRFGDIPLQTFTEALTFDGYGFAIVQLGGSLRAFTNAGTNTLAIEANVSVAILSDYVGVYSGGFGHSFILHEVEAIWDPYLLPRTFRKMVWIADGLDDNWATSYPDIPGFSDATVQSEISLAAPNYPLMYHQGDISAEALTVAPGATVNLNVFYKATLGQDFPPATYTQIKAMVSGYFKIWET